MRNTALMRALSMFTAIICLVLLVNGIHNIGSANEDYRTEYRSVTRLEKRIDKYVETSAQLAESDVDIEKEAAQLDEMVAEHDSTASQHKTDISLMTAKKSGMLQGADALWAAKAELESQKALLDANKEQLEQLAAMKPMLEASIASGQQTISDVDEAIRQADEVFEQESADVDSVLNAIDAAANAYNSLYAQLPMISTAMGTDVKVMLAGQGIDVDMIYGMVNDPMTYAGLKYSISGSLADPVQFAQAKGMYNANRAQIVAAEAGFQDSIDQMSSQLLQLEQGLAGLAMMKQGEATIQASLEEIWYQLGEIEKQEKELEEEKTTLIDLSEDIDELSERVDGYQTVDQRNKAARAMLLAYKDIKVQVDEGTDLEEAALSVLDSMKNAAEGKKSAYIRSSGFAIAAAIAGVLATVCCYFEKIKVIPWFYVSSGAAIACCIVASILFQGKGDFYAAIIAAIFLALGIILARPEKRKIISE